MKTTLRKKAPFVASPFKGITPVTGAQQPSLPGAPQAPKAPSLKPLPRLTTTARPTPPSPTRTPFRQPFEDEPVDPNAYVPKEGEKPHPPYTPPVDIPRDPKAQSHFLRQSRRFGEEDSRIQWLPYGRYKNQDGDKHNVEVLLKQYQPQWNAVPPELKVELTHYPLDSVKDYLYMKRHVDNAGEGALVEVDGITTSAKNAVEYILRRMREGLEHEQKKTVNMVSQRAQPQVFGG
jgi:hypothetical protein